MACSIALRRASASGLINKLFNPIRSVAVAPSAATRSFNTESQMRQYEDDERSIDVKRQSDRSISRRRESFPSLVTGNVFDPFVSPTRSLSQVLNLMDQMIENPFVAGGMGSGTTRRGWDAKEDENALYVRIDMPGLGKEDVKVVVEENTLIIKGEGGKESDEEKDGRKYSSRTDLPENLYKLDEIKAEMKNGVLRVIVPKVKEEERKNVHEVKIE
ncbi:heat shock 22 kDa protein, mitochondrial [Telopea speciosissima]|uniref:heat shock 22 kDa protein, mitochondrial n=1 Tax=Telopea speciosissima TaxID=54955 RepID=UPI001CC6190E|nr:heat shock 22 kDa protein, mitochondrial [Telopea speciosissima]